MFDPRLPIAKALITPGQPPKFAISQPVARKITGRDELMDYGSSALISSCNNNQIAPCYSERNSRKDESLNNGQIVIEGRPSLEHKIYPLTNTVNIKDSLLTVIESIPPETLVAIIKFFMLSLASLANGNQTPQAQAIPADNHLKDTLQLVLAACGLKLPNEDVENSKEFPRQVKIVFDEMVKNRNSIFQKVDLTKRLQKKVNAKEIEAVLEFLISEGGVLEKLEQKKNPSGRDPSPQYRLLWNNPKYFQMPKSF